MLQINLTIKGTNTVLRTWKKDVTLSMTEMQDLVAMLKLAFPAIGLYGIEVINEWRPLVLPTLTMEQFKKALFDVMLADKSVPPSWDDFKKRLEEAKTVKEFLGGK